MSKVKVEYIGRKKDFKWRDGESFPIKMEAKEAKVLIEQNPNTFKSPELDALIAKLQGEIEATKTSMSDAGEEANTPPKDEE